MILFAGCSGDSTESESTAIRPNVNAPAVVRDIDDQSNLYAIAYGMGLVIACNPETYLDSEGKNKVDAPAFRALDRLSEKYSGLANELEIANGLGGALQTVTEEHAAGRTDIC